MRYLHSENQSPLQVHGQQLHWVLKPQILYALPTLSAAGSPTNLYTFLALDPLAQTGFLRATRRVGSANASRRNGVWSLGFSFYAFYRLDAPVAHEHDLVRVGSISEAKALSSLAFC